MAKIAVFALLESPKIEFTQNLNDRKIMKFPHYVEVFFVNNLLSFEIEPVGDVTNVYLSFALKFR